VCDVVKTALAYRQRLLTELSAIDGFLRLADELLAQGAAAPTHARTAVSGNGSVPPTVPERDEQEEPGRPPQHDRPGDGLSFRGAGEQRMRGSAA